MTAETREHLIGTADGRRLAVIEGGVADGWPLIWHHGTPASGVLRRRDLEEAARRGVRMIGFDRPGCGYSDPRPGRRVVDVVDDVVTIADHLGFERFATIGLSGGGPHALACAARLPERVTAAVVVAGIAPYGAERLDFLAGMGEDNVQEFAAALEGESALVSFLEPLARDIRASTAQGIAELISSLLPPVDRAVVTNEAATFLEATSHRSLKNGIGGWRDDDLAFVRPWGFELDEIRVPVQIWQGRQDRMVPFAHGRWLAEHVPNAEAELRDDEGHLSIAVHHIDDIFDWVLKHAQTR